MGRTSAVCRLRQAPQGGCRMATRRVESDNGFPHSGAVPERSCRSDFFQRTAPAPTDLLWNKAARLGVVNLRMNLPPFPPRITRKAAPADKQASSVRSSNNSWKTRQVQPSAHLPISADDNTERLEHPERRRRQPSTVSRGRAFTSKQIVRGAGSWGTRCPVALASRSFMIPGKGLPMPIDRSSSDNN